MSDQFAKLYCINKLSKVLSSRADHDVCGKIFTLSCIITYEWQFKWPLDSAPFAKHSRQMSKRFFSSLQSLQAMYGSRRIFSQLLQTEDTSI